MKKKPETESKTKKFNVWDIITDLSKDKKQVIRTSENPIKAWKEYNPFIVNRGFSYFPDTIVIANQVNRMGNLPVHMQHDFYMGEVRSKARFQKWPKKANTETVDLICEAYNINKERAWEYLSILTDDQVEQIRKLHNKGGT